MMKTESGDGPVEPMGNRGVRLDQLLAGPQIGRMSGPTDVKVQSIAYDSRRVTPGALFFALRGEKLDGAKFVEDAIARGAIAIATEYPEQVHSRDVAVVELLRGLDRRALAMASADFYGRPAEAA